MAVDQYAPCPCGSGKKLKFCKCVDQPHEYEKILRLIEGGQDIAAADRINGMLKKTPNAAWLLALKGELMLKLEEVDSFHEVAVRFLKLKPDNARALAMRAISACLKREPVEEAVRYLLDSFSEAREHLSNYSILGLRLIVIEMAAQNRYSLIGFWLSIIDNLKLKTGLDIPLPDSLQSVNLLMRVPLTISTSKPDGPWRERLAEVTTLVKSFRFAQAESKIRSLLRDYPDQPTALCYLLRCQSALLDEQGAYQTAKRLSEHPEVSTEDQIYFGAIRLELEAPEGGLAFPSVTRCFEVESPDTVVEELRKCECLEELPNQDNIYDRVAARFSSEVPPKIVFRIFNEREHSVTSGLNGLFLTLEELPDAVSSTLNPTEVTVKARQYGGLIIVFGRQTDKPAQLICDSMHLPEFIESLERTLEKLSGVQQTEDTEGVMIPLTSALARCYADSIVSGTVETTDYVYVALHKRFLEYPLNCLDGLTPAEASKDEKYSRLLESVLTHLQCQQDLMLPRRVIARIYSDLGLKRPGTSTKLKDLDDSRSSVVDWLNADRSDTEFERLLAELNYSAAIRADALAAETCERLIYHDQLQELKPELLDAIAQISAIHPSVSFILEAYDRLIPVMHQHGHPVGSLILNKVQLMSRIGKPEAAQQALQDATEKYPDDPELTSFLINLAQQAHNEERNLNSDSLANQLLSGGASATGVSPSNQDRSAPAATDSDLILPTSEGGGEDSGGGKLWLPNA